MIRKLLLTLAIILTGFAAPSLAATSQPFDSQAFQQAQAAGKPILIHVSADWCPGCTKQKPIIDALDDRVSVFTIDYDSQKGLVRQFKVQKQSTLIVFKGKDEVARTLGVTDPKAIQADIDKAL